MAAAVVVARKAGPSHRHDNRVDDGTGERVPDEGAADCLREGMLERKIVNTHSLEVLWQQRLLVLGMDKLFLCKPSDRQYVYDHIPLSEIVEVNALSGAFSMIEGHSCENVVGHVVTATTVATTPSGGSKKALVGEDSWLDQLATDGGYVHTEASAVRANVLVQQGRRLKATDWNGSSDPYVVLRLASAPETSKTQTGVVSKNVNPVWNETLHLQPPVLGSDARQHHPYRVGYAAGRKRAELVPAR